MNKAILMGNITKDIELKNLEGGTVVANFSIAVSRKFVKPGEERQSDFFNLTAFGKTAEFISKYFAKGSKILVECRIQNRTYEVDGVKKYATDFIVENTYFAGGSKTSNENNTNSDISGEYITIDDTAQLPF